MATNEHGWTRLIRFYPCLFVALLSGCSRYADFTLPPPEASGPHGPFRWEASADPVIARRDAVDVLNPSVIKFRGEYLNLFSSFDGKIWTTSVASSADGVAWSNRGRVLAPSEGYIAANGSALVVGDEVLYWYETGDPFYVALVRSVDGAKWSSGVAVMRAGPYGSFDERGIADPYVIRAGDRYYMYYLGTDRAKRQRLGVARSSDGVTWEKLRSNPVLDLAGEEGLGEPAVWSSGGAWWMLYTWRDREERRKMSLAKSPDGVHWSREPLVIAGESAWDREVVCDPSVEVTPSGVRVWFGGGDVRRPDERLNGQIGVGWLK